ncbi:MAG: methyltransferase domain-containing protein [Thermofilum sp.]
MSLSSYILRRFLRNPSEALRMKRAADEVKEYIVWKLHAVLERENLFSHLATQPWWSLADKQLAKIVGDVLAEEGFAKWQGNVLVMKGFPEKPTITTTEAADMVPLIDRALEFLPIALLTGAKPSEEEAKALKAKILDNFAVRLELESAIEVAELDKLGREAVIADVFPRVGASTLTLLEQTAAKVVVIEPHAQNLETIKSLIKLHHLEERVSYVLSPLERISLDKHVDAVFMGETIHWLPNPHLTLASVRSILKPGGILAIAQSLYSSVGLAASIPGYLVGALRPPPTSDELRGLLRGAGFKVDKWLESMGVALVRAVTA